MKARRTILCVGADEQSLSLRAFQLETWGYDALTATSTKEAVGILATEVEVDLLVAELPLEGMNARLFVRAKRWHPQLLVLVTNNHAGWYDPLGANVLLPKGSDSPAELRERIRVLMVRQRGPKKKLNSTAKLAAARKVA